MTYTTYYSYKWCDTSGYWHTGYPTSGCTYTYIHGCDAFGTWHDCTPALDGYVEGTSGADLIDYSYTGDPEGDKIDHNDQILSGEGVNDDIVLAGAGNDTVIAGTGNDDVYGGTGDDKIYGGSGNDILRGEDGNDKIYGGEGKDIAYGGAGADTVMGDGGDDSVYGGTGNDVLYGDSSTTTTTVPGGSATFDWATANIDGSNVVTAGGSSVTISVSTPTTTEGHSFSISSLAGGSELSSYSVTIPTKVITTFSAPVSGVSFEIFDVDSATGCWDDKVTIIALDANGNQVPVTFSNTYLHTISGSTIEGAGNAYGGVEGSGAADTVTVTISSPIVSLTIIHDNGDSATTSGTIGIGDLHFTTPSITETVTEGNDLVMGGDGDDNIYGGGGNDTLEGECGNDTLYGGTGNDTIEGGGGADSIDGGAGNDVLYGDSAAGGGSTSGGTVASGTFDWATANIDGSNTLTIGGNTVTLSVSTPTTSEGHSFSIGSLAGGTEVTSAGVTMPTKLITNFSTAVSDITFEIFDVDSGAGWDDKVTVIALDAAGNQVPVVFSNTYLHTVTGNTVEGSGNSNPGVEGSGALDTVSVSIAGPIVSLTIVHDNGGSTSTSGTVGVSDLHFSVGDTSVVCDDLGDTITGGDGSDMIYGGAADDKLYGGTGDDKIYGGDGNDYIEFGTGNDVVYGGAGNDLIDDAAGTSLAGNDTVYGGDGDDKVYTGGGNDLVHGDAGNDFLLGEGGDDTIYGDDGNDTLCGMDGNDTLYGGDGNDLLEGMNNDDLMYGGAGNDRITGDAGNDVAYGGDGDDSITGGTGNDVIYGDAGNDILSGGNDRDIIHAGAGDTVDGGAGGDDYDILDLTGQGPFYLTNVTPDSNGNGINGTVVFVDASGNPTGETLTFTEIEKVVGEEVNRGPDAVDDTATVDEDGSVVINVLGNDTDPDGDTLTVTSATSPNGTVTINPDGTLTFEPNDNFSGDTTITYTVSDGNGGTDTATVNVHVNPVNDGPDAVDDTATVDEDGSVVINVLGNDTDPDGDTLTVTSATSPNGTVTINPDGTLTFEPNDNFSGDTTITYTIDDGNGGTDTATVNVHVNPVNDGPDAVDDTATVDEDGSVVINVLGNDTDPDGDTLTVTSATSPNGTVTINPDGTLTFEPNDNFSGDTTISYTIDDGNGGTDTATVNVHVNPVNDAPDAVDDVASTAFNTAITVDLLANDTDVDGDTLTVTSVSVPASQGTIVDNGDGTVTFTPAPGFEGDATISYSISDGNGGTDSATHVVTVAAGLLDGTVEGTSGDDLIDDFYTGDPDGDMVDNNDAILPGDTGNDDLIYGYGGNDRIDAGDGNDEVYGGDGNDIILGREGEDTLYGDAGKDQITGGSENDTIFGGTGDDTIVGSGGEDYLSGDEGKDLIYGGADDDLIYGGADDDAIEGFAGDDSIYGGTGNDKIDAGAGNDYVSGGDGDDVILGRGGEDNIHGDAGNDKLTGGEDDDQIYGGTGNDTIVGDGGEDSLFGGAGNDLITGGDDNDYVEGGSGDDTVYGFSGDDTITSGSGNDVVDGGSGNDVIDTGNGSSALPDVAYPGVYPADLFPHNDHDTVYGGAGDDTISTGDDDDTIFGGSGNDTIDAGIDDDYVEAGTGNDTIIGSEGNDEIYGGDGDDVIRGGLEIDTLDLPDDLDGDGITGEPGEDLVTTNNNDTLFGGAGNDIIYGNDDDGTLYGGTGNDTLDGGVDDDTVYGDDGDDTIIGGQGNDALYGGFGSDTFLGGNGGDVVVGGEDPDDGDWDVLDLTGSGVDHITYTSADQEDGIVTFTDGSTMTFSAIESVIPGFTPGTTIATPKGERLVEELQVGDRIITRDNGIQEIAWVGQKVMTGKALVQNSHLRPILIKAGALGNGLPERDMLVSPNHRVLVASDLTQLYFEEREVLAAAKHLVGAAGIHQIDVMQTTYVHFMFERHEVVLSNGAWTESFQPGDYSLKGIGNSQRNEIFELFPELSQKDGLENYQSARKSLKKHEARLLVK